MQSDWGQRAPCLGWALFADDAGQAALRELLRREETRYTHAAPPCGTLSRARENLVPLALQRLGAPSPPPLRSNAFLEGLPPLKGLDLHKVTLANRLAYFVAEVMAALHEKGVFFTVENPLNSFLWLLPPFLRLAALAGVRLIKYQACMHGGNRPKRQALMTSVPARFTAPPRT